MHLNKVLQEALNPHTQEKAEQTFGEILFREGDRVMQVRNNYDIVWKKADSSMIGTGIFNGDVGIIRSIDKNLEIVSVLFDDRIAEYDFTQLIELEPAYAMTVQKSGQRIPGGSPEWVECFAVSSQPQHSLHRHHTRKGIAGHCGSRRYHRRHGKQRKGRSSLYRSEITAAE